MNNRQHIASLMPPPIKGTEVVHPNGDTQDIVATMLSMDKRAAAETTKLAPTLAGGSVHTTCLNIFQFIKQHIRYQEDPSGQQWVQSPAALFQRGVGDCKSFAIFAASVLKNLGIKHFYRFTAPSASTDYGHVFLIVPNGTGYITLDATLPEFNKEAKTPKRIDYAGDMPRGCAGIGRAAVGATRQLQLKGMPQAQANAIAQSLMLQGDPQKAAQFVKDHLEANGVLQIEWTGRPKLNAIKVSSAIAGPLKDRIKNNMLKTALQKNMTASAPYFMYLYYTECRYAKDFPRYTIAVEKLFNALDLIMGIANSSEGVINTSFTKAEKDTVVAAYKRGDMVQFDTLYRKLWAKFKTSTAYELLNEAMVWYFSKPTIDKLANAGKFGAGAGAYVTAAYILQFIQGEKTSIPAGPILNAYNQYKAQIPTIITQIEGWMRPELAKQWEVWNQPALVVMGDGVECVPFTAAERNSGQVRKGTTMGKQGWMGIWVTVPAGVNPKTFIDGIYTPPTTNTGNSGKGGKMSQKPIFFAQGIQLLGTATYKAQPYTAEYKTVRPIQISADKKKVLLVINLQVEFTGKKSGGWVLSNISPMWNKNSAHAFRAVGFPMMPSPSAINGAAVGEIATATIAIIISSVLAAVLAIIAAVAQIIKDMKVPKGSDALIPQQPDFGAPYVANGKTYVPQPDGSTDVYDSNGNFEGKLPKGSTLPFPDATGGISPTMIMLGIAAVAAIILIS